MITIFLHHDGRTEQVQSIDRSWLNHASGATVWVDLAAPSIPESLILSDTFAFHPLSVEDAMSVLQYPKIEPYDGYLYVVLHGIDFRRAEHGFRTHDVDFFLGRNYLVTVHDGYSQSIEGLRDHCPRNANLMGDGPVGLFHRIVDSMVDGYRPEVEKLENALDEMENAVFTDVPQELIREILAQKRDVSSLRRVTTPQRQGTQRPRTRPAGSRRWPRGRRAAVRVRPSPPAADTIAPTCRGLGVAWQCPDHAKVAAPAASCRPCPCRSC